MKQRNTIQKKLVIEAANSLLNHPTADEVYKKVIETHPNVSRGTVYRILSSLVMSNTLLRIPVTDAADRYDIDTHLHYHLKCESCGEFLDIELPDMEEFIDAIEAKSGFAINRYNLVFTGTCKNCQVRHAEKIE